MDWLFKCPTKPLAIVYRAQELGLSFKVRQNQTIHHGLVSCDWGHCVLWSYKKITHNGREGSGITNPNRFHLSQTILPSMTLGDWKERKINTLKISSEKT